MGMVMDFINVYDNFLSSEECQHYINLFESSTSKEGVCYHDGVDGVFYNIKKTRELTPDITLFSTCKFNLIHERLKDVVSQYRDDYKVWDYYKWDIEIDDGFNFAKYETDDCGFKDWHTEHGLGNVQCRRVLVWMVYLNNAQSGTEFLAFDNVDAKEGRCIIWPAGFTHIHRSAPNKGLKYVMTGWISLSQNDYN